MLDFVYFIPAFPLIGFALLVMFGKKLGDPKAGWIGFTAVFLAFLSTLITWLGLLTHDGRLRTYDKNAFTWISAGTLHVNVGFLVDPLSMVMALFVTGVSSLIHLYSIGYMKGDKRFHQFFVYLNLFVFSMLVLVLADNLLLLFLGWEGVGACSYFLVGFWFERASAATAAKKAFIVNRIGDVGLLLGIFLVFKELGTLTFFTENQNGFLDLVPQLGQGTVTAIALLLFVGAIGKSAQLPLHVWLPDAMEGPTPVSALIHAATMVTAGVYLMVRVGPLLHLSHTASLTVAIVGVAGALFAATIACAQDDIKRVLAYSTMSQLGYMFLAVGAGAYDMGIFHMVTHAFFKALLFLSAGAVIHSLHDQQDLKKMGNLHKYLPITWATFLIGWLAISGVPPFAGFWSKDDVLLAAWNYNKALWGIGLFTVLLTAYYMSRLYFLAFYGKDRWESSLESHGHGTKADAKPHESPRLMTVPMIILAVLSVVGGFLDVAWHPFKDVLTDFLHPVVSTYTSPLVHTATSTKWWLDIASIVCAAVGVGASFLISRNSVTWPSKLEPRVLVRAWFIDPLYEYMFEKPGRLLANWFSSVFDGRLVDGLVNGTARTVGLTGSGLRKAQNGYVRTYAVSIASGTALVLVWALIRSAR